MRITWHWTSDIDELVIWSPLLVNGTFIHILMKLVAWYIHIFLSFFLVVNDIDVLTRYKRSRRFAVAQKRGGVVEECCFSSCSYENLLLYCSQVRTNNSSTMWRHDRDTVNAYIIFVERYTCKLCDNLCLRWNSI